MEQHQRALTIRPELAPDFYGHGFTDDTDVFGKGDLAKRLTRMFGELTQGTVSILDGRWGSGKTVFAGMLKQHLQTQGYPCIYFDAFANDYISDPFQSVVTAFVREAKAARQNGETVYESFLSRAGKAAKLVATPTAKIGAKVLTLGVIGATELDAIASVADDISDTSEAAVKAMLEEQASAEASFKALRQSLSDLPMLLAKELASAGESSEPANVANPSLIVIIDELDRCRPDFALGVLEVLKHFFRVDGIHFMLVTNISHLELSVRKQYGVGESAGEYLQKFYDFVIPFESAQSGYQDSAAARYAKRHLQAMMQGASTRDGHELVETAGKIITTYDLSIRQAERLISNVILARIDFQSRIFRPEVLIVMLSLIKVIDTELYQSIKRGRIDKRRFERFMQLGKWPGEGWVGHVQTAMEYLTNSDLDVNDPKYVDLERWYAPWGSANRLDTLTRLANTVLDKFG